MAEHTEADEARFRELVLYIAERMEGDPSFGAVKLNKVLYFSDFLHFRQSGRPLTGVEYTKLPYGPAPRRLLPLQQELIRGEEAKLIERDYLGYCQKRLVALRDADRSVFEPSELKLVDQVIDALWGAQAVSVTALSHKESVGWRAALPGERIPYETALLSQESPDEEDERRASQLAEEHGWAPT